MGYQDEISQELCKDKKTWSDADSYESPFPIPMSNVHICHLINQIDIISSLVRDKPSQQNQKTKQIWLVVFIPKCNPMSDF